MLIEQTLESMRAMRLLGMAEAMEEQMQTPGARKLSFEDRIGLLIERERIHRTDRRVTRLHLSELGLEIAWHHPHQPAFVVRIFQSGNRVIEDFVIDFHDCSG